MSKEKFEPLYWVCFCGGTEISADENGVACCADCGTNVVDPPADNNKEEE